MLYKYLIIPFIAALISQTIKVIIETKRYHKLNIKRFFDGMGGMPSTHSALTSSLTTIIYLNYCVLILYRQKNSSNSIIIASKQNSIIIS